MTNEILTMEELDTVSGGNFEELDELARAMSDNLFVMGMATLSTITPGGCKLVKSQVTKILDKMGIEADIDVNFMGGFGFGIGEKHNTYKDKATGQSLTHAQVLNRIKAVIRA